MYIGAGHIPGKSFTKMSHETFDKFFRVGTVLQEKLNGRFPSRSFVYKMIKKEKNGICQSSRNPKSSVHFMCRFWVV